MAYELRIGMRIRAPRETVFERLLTPHHLARWWCNFAQVEPKPGGKFVFGGDYVIAQPPEPEPAWKCAFTGGTVRKSVTFAWPLFGGDTVVTWEVDDAPEGSVFRATHAGLPHLRSTCGSLHDAWRMCLGNLKAIAENRGDAFRPDHYPVREPRIKLDTVLDVPREKAFAAISGPEVRAWAALDGDPVVEPRVGGKFELGWSGAAKVAAFEPPRRLAVDWPHAEGMTHVSFAFEEKSGDRCALHFLHEDFPPEEDPPIVALRCRWSDRLVGLKNLVESGETGFTEPYAAQVLAR
ncbi:MAG TPA: SRPBCC family protein [Thermoplasmata archaeon]|nr:SRPBCC family protein [Thermoplasmata archaeon]